MLNHGALTNLFVAAGRAVSLSSFCRAVSFSSPSRPFSSHSLVRSSSANGPVTRTAASALRFQQRQSPQKKKRLTVPDRDTGSVVGYSTANGYNLLSLAQKLERQGLYELQSIDEELLPTCLYAKARYKVDEEKDIFFFENGSVIFWNVPELERDNVLIFVKSVETSEGYRDETVHEESELMSFSQENDVNVSRLQHGRILLSSADKSLDKYAFSNGIANSVKLGILEASLDRIIDSIEHISEDLKRGVSIRLTRQEVLQKTGEIFALRHVLNLSSDLLDTPDFYWDREDLEKMYHNTCAHLSIGKRTRVMNEKLTHCNELMNLITNHLNDDHHVRLEWFIIILIMIEVGFELLHFAEKYF